MDELDLKTQILAYIQEELAYDLDSTLEANSELLESGLLDSMAAVQLVSFCEDELNANFLPDDLTIENFNTVNAVVALIRQRSE